MHTGIERIKALIKEDGFEAGMRELGRLLNRIDRTAEIDSQG